MLLIPAALIGGCKEEPDVVHVTIANRSSLEIREIRVSLASVERRLGSLPPGKEVSTTFPPVRGEAGFHVSGEVGEGKRIEESVGYIDNAIRESEISFRDSPEGSGISVTTSE
jgi:hypothetical protein